MADALSLSRAADLGEVGITGPAASAIAGFFGNLDEEENVAPEPMVEFDEAAVLAWLGTVPGLTAQQRAAAAAEMAEAEYNGPHIFHATAKSLQRLLKGTAAEAAVPALLAARDAHLAAEVAEPELATAAPAAAPGCQICFEAYGSARPSLTSF